MHKIKQIPVLASMVLLIFIAGCERQEKEKAKVDSDVKGDLFEVSTVSTRTESSYPAYFGKGPVISEPSFLPGGGMSVIIMVKGEDGETYSYTAGNIKANDESFIFIVKCSVKNALDKVQNFRVGDISIKTEEAKIDFFAVGLEKYVFAKNKEDRDIVKNKEIALEPKEEKIITYVFGIPKISKSWKLTYKNAWSQVFEK